LDAPLATEMSSSYRHWCLMARTLEIVGDRWSLLIVRDLLRGPRRFSDLKGRLSGVTPKWLTLRLRQLERAGIVARDSEEGRREVWYELTDKGRELAPVIESLTFWGIKHLRQLPATGEAVHPEHVLLGLATALNGFGARPNRAVSWKFRFPDDCYVVRFDGERWRSEAGDKPAQVVIATTPQAWARFMMQPRKLPSREIKLSGKTREIEYLQAVFRRRKGVDA
jgi:DNA-binding HxlR family transcriptional regulator